MNLILLCKLEIEDHSRELASLEASTTSLVQQASGLVGLIGQEFFP